MKRTETSKIILCALYFLMFLMVGFTMYMTYVTSDITLLQPIIMGIFTLCSSATGFYYWKAKAENMEKIRNARAKSSVQEVDMSDITSIPDNTTDILRTSLDNELDEAALENTDTIIDTE